ncbi:uncharacterized protein METZ01_LOCUS231003 [marine metagenome]|uniref:Acyltransferase n=1 Tax=marine metagenome TaxID=408172 RepID=A0A382GT47_9ZZZZ
MNLSDYIRKRNGVPFGAKNSLKNMMIRSLGAGMFSKFWNYWNYWNPIWGYYLGKFVFKPLKYFLPSSLSLILTFCICGLLHDFVIMLYRWELTLLFTPWFLIMGLWVVISDLVKLDYSKFLWVNRALINITSIGICFIIAYQVRLL